MAKRSRSSGILETIRTGLLGGIAVLRADQGQEHQRERRTAAARKVADSVRRQRGTASPSGDCARKSAVKRAHQ